jgi:hypothetical protein
MGKSVLLDRFISLTEKRQEIAPGKDNVSLEPSLGHLLGNLFHHILQKVMG